MAAVRITTHLASPPVGTSGLGMDVRQGWSGIPRAIGSAKGYLEGFAIVMRLQSDKALVSDAVPGREFLRIIKDLRMSVAGQPLFNPGLDGADLRDDLIMRTGKNSDPSNQGANQNVDQAAVGAGAYDKVTLFYNFTDRSQEHKRDGAIALALLDERVDPDVALQWTHATALPGAPAGWTLQGIIQLDVYVTVRYEAIARRGPLPVLTQQTPAETTARISPARPNAVTRLDYCIGRPTLEEVGGQDVSGWLGVAIRLEAMQQKTKNAPELGYAAALQRISDIDDPADMQPGVGYMPFYVPRRQVGSSDLMSADVGWDIAGRAQHTRTRILHRQRVEFDAAMTAHAARLQTGTPEAVAVTSTPAGLMTRKLR